MANKAYFNGKWYLVEETGGRMRPSAESLRGFVDGVDVKYVEDPTTGHFVPERDAPPPPQPTVLKPGQKEYRVITQADQWFMGKFSPDRMNTLLNVLASEGWRLVAVAAADRATWFGSFGGTTRQEMVLFLERDVVAETPIKPYEETLKDAL